MLFITAGYIESRSNYTFIKNRIPAVVEDLGASAHAKAVSEERSKGAFVMGAEATNINNLLSRNQELVRSKQKGGDK